MDATPPGYAWDWFSRQRLLWREARRRLCVGPHPTAGRYRTAETKSDVLALLRADFPVDGHVRATVYRVVIDLAFLGRSTPPFRRLGVRTPPRGMRWWWTTITGEDLGAARPDAPALAEQLTLDEVHEGLGG